VQFRFRQVWSERALVFAYVMAAVSLGLAIGGWGQPIRNSGHEAIKYAQVVVIALWTTLPPLWYFVEHMFIHTPNCFPASAREADLDENELKLVLDYQKLEFDIAKYRQELTSKGWIALISTLFLLYFWKDLGKG
jgi:cytochrome bd-type quinol oxidase subunit 1